VVGLSEYIAPEVRRLQRGAGLVLAGSVSALRQRLAGGFSAPVLFSAYLGPSMNPTLSEWDLLEIVPYGRSPIRDGDVILFLPPAEEQPVVHRVWSVTPVGICTRGDNNGLVDPWLLQATDVVGRVVAARRGQRRRIVAGGATGRWVAQFTRWGVAIDRVASRALHPLYRSLTHRGTLGSLLSVALRPRVVAFGVGSSRRLRLMMGRIAIGIYDAQRSRWRIRRPFALFVDESKLPTV